MWKYFLFIAPLFRKVFGIFPAFATFFRSSKKNHYKSEMDWFVIEPGSPR